MPTKHIQGEVLEGCDVGSPPQSHELALVREKEFQKGNANRATLAVARKMVAYLLVVDREQRDFLPAEEHSSTAA